MVSVGSRRASVLVVDDDELVRHVVARMLRVGGYDVREAEVAARALTALERQEADVVLSDIMMPEMNGCELGRVVSRRWPETRVLLYSGHIFDSLLESGVCPEDIPFIRKPFSAAELHARVDAALRSDPYRFPDDEPSAS